MDTVTGRMKFEHPLRNRSILQLGISGYELALNISQSMAERDDEEESKLHVRRKMMSRPSSM
jgi:hypothetical protein